MPDSTPTRRGLRAKAKSRLVRRWVLISAGALLLVAVGITAWILPRGLSARSELLAAIPAAKALPAQLMSGDSEEAAQSAKKMGEHTAAARDLTSDFVWQSLEWIPWAGENLRAVRLAAISADELATKAVAPAASIDIESFKPVDGRIDVDAIRDLGALVDSVAETVTSAESRLATIDRSQLIGQVDSGVTQLDDALAQAGGIIGGVQDAVALLPAALGADGPRNYLMLFETNAETRGTGGLPGALLLLTVDDGVLEVAKIASSFEFPWALDVPILPVDAETEALYGSKIARHIGDITLTPHFPYTAQLGQAFWATVHDGAVDGVMSFDPVALGYLLEATGPVVLPTGEQLTSENAAPLLLNESYLRYPDLHVQDAFFAAAATAIFDAVKSGSGSTIALVDALNLAIDERRLNFWSANEDEQLLIAKTPMSGILPADNVETTAIGVYFNDNTSGKLEYYLDTAIDITSNHCESNTPTVQSTVTLTSNVPADAATSLPKYVHGSWYTPGHIMMDLVVYGPVGGKLSAFTLDGKPTSPVYTGTHLERPAAKATFRIQPGQTVKFGYEIVGAEGEYGPLDVRHTPMFRPVTVTAPSATC